MAAEAAASRHRRWRRFDLRLYLLWRRRLGRLHARRRHAERHSGWLLGGLGWQRWRRLAGARGHIVEHDAGHRRRYLGRRRRASLRTAGIDRNGLHAARTTAFIAGSVILRLGVGLRGILTEAAQHFLARLSAIVLISLDDRHPPRRDGKQRLVRVRQCAADAYRAHQRGSGDEHPASALPGLLGVAKLVILVLGLGLGIAMRLGPVGAGIGTLLKL